MANKKILVSVEKNYFNKLVMCMWMRRGKNLATVS